MTAPAITPELVGEALDAAWSAAIDGTGQVPDALTLTRYGLRATFTGSTFAVAVADRLAAPQPPP